ncbi:hypothetical protein B0H14DRAFT_3537318 [Mycena olivaceomarginata]|nr:hypothetical protein B0H14DRAFT_3537318 [Mycena olivaceomarginata]
MLRYVLQPVRHESFYRKWAGKRNMKGEPWSLSLAFSFSFSFVLGFAPSRIFSSGLGREERVCTSRVPVSSTLVPCLSYPAPLISPPSLPPYFLPSFLLLPPPQPPILTPPQVSVYMREWALARWAEGSKPDLALELPRSSARCARCRRGRSARRRRSALVARLGLRG